MFEHTRRRPRYPRIKDRRQAGFSLVELLVSVVIMVEVLIGLLIIFDASTRLARGQTHLAELQQSLRVGQAELVRFVRMAGLGGLPVTMLNLPAGQPNAGAPIYDTFGIFPRSGYAVSVLNNVAEATIVGVVDPMAADQGTDVVLPGSDVLILRGVFETPMFYLDPPIDTSTWFTDTDGDLESDLFSGTIVLPERARISGREYWDYPQEIGELSEVLTDADTDSEGLALILRDTINPNAYVVVSFDFGNTAPNDLIPSDCPNVVVHASTSVDDRPQCISFAVRLDPDEALATGHGAAYANLSRGTTLQAPATPSETTLAVDASIPDRIELPTQIGSVGLIDEYRFFVRAEWEVPGDESTRLTPVLSRARFFPGSNTQRDRIDIADNVLDLQIAIAADADPVDTAGYGFITDGDEDSAEDGDSDEILFNVPGDTVTPAPPSLSGGDDTHDYTAPEGDTAVVTWYDTDLEFHYLRINTLVQARFADLNHRAPDLVAIEDYNRGAAFSVAGENYTLNNEVQFRRRWLQTIVELRNLL